MFLDERGYLKIDSCHHGDCLTVMEYIPDKSVNMILCDLP